MQTVFSIFVQMLWCMFAITWDLALFNMISQQTEEILYLVCDFSAKVSGSSSRAPMAG